MSKMKLKYFGIVVRANKLCICTASLNGCITEMTKQGRPGRRRSDDVSLENKSEESSRELKHYYLRTCLLSVVCAAVVEAT